MARKEDKQPQYLPLIVKAKLHTGGRDYEKIKEEFEQYHPQAPYRYRDNFEKFQKDWTSGEYDPGMTFTFKDSEVEVLEVLQEEVDNIDHEAVKRQVAAAEDAQYQKRRKQRQRRKQASKGSRYQRKYF